eukprot:gnl/MRDRNA2_/MRDRNA2_35066_c0_seq1.p1 gnl/MRDRNA2_/MRDRNA2_35066_c0~~gnl/MRDRNA2_/MRDRNA2_35066_c0_seq1.p1  ORF type:complete len:377 (-),score=62.89 gnl/MRDRNA2_/MRDRNA2_35066_c0_seq1:350-1480(-)
MRLACIMLACAKVLILSRKADDTSHNLIDRALEAQCVGHSWLDFTMLAKRSCCSCKLQRQRQGPDRTNLEHSTQQPRRLMEGPESVDESHLIRSDFNVIRAPADGDCLYHSLAHGDGKRDDAKSLRREIARFLLQNPSLQIGGVELQDWVKWDGEEKEENCTVADYARRIADTGEWGGAMETTIFSHMRQVNVSVYEQSFRIGSFKRISSFDYPGANKIINILYRGGLHYDLLEPRVTPLTAPGATEPDVADIIEATGGVSSETKELALARAYSLVGSWDGWVAFTDFVHKGETEADGPFLVAEVPVSKGRDIEFQIVCEHDYKQRLFPASDGRTIWGPSSGGDRRNWHLDAPAQQALAHQIFPSSSGWSWTWAKG